MRSSRNTVPPDVAEVAMLRRLAPRNQTRRPKPQQAQRVMP